VEIILAKLGLAIDYTQELLIAALILSRIVTVVIMTPWLGGKLIPPEIKMGVSGLVTIIVWPLARAQVSDIPITPIPFLFLMMKEVLVGFAIGFAAAHVFWAMEIAGRIIDTTRGASMSEVMVPQSGERATPFGDMFYQVLIVIFLAMGGHRIFFDAFASSFISIPIHKSIMFGDGLLPFFDYMVRITGEVLFVGVLIAAPVIAATFLTDLVFGILNRVSPQLNAYFLSMPVKAMAGIIMVIIAMAPLSERMGHYAVWSLQTIEQIIALLAIG
jgi:flagellar biosynthesis protein FliR